MNAHGPQPVAAVLLLRPRAAGAGAEGVGRQAGERRGRPAGVLPPREDERGGTLRARTPRRWSAKRSASRMRADRRRASRRCCRRRHRSSSLRGVRSSTARSRAALRRYYEPFLELARDRDVPLVLSAPTWRANATGTSARLRGRTTSPGQPPGGRVSRGLAADHDDVVIEGSVGPRSDAYSPTLLDGRGRSGAVSRRPARTFAEAGCAQATALTLTYAEEAVGIARRRSRPGFRLSSASRSRPTAGFRAASRSRRRS